MITLQKLHLENFINIESVDLDFSASYLSIFTGPNGAGKSSIIEAIALCFTERRRGDSFKDFIKHGNTNAAIHLEATYQHHPVVFDVELVNKPGWSPFKRLIKYKGITYKNSECTPLLESFGLDYLQHIMFSLQGENNVVDLKPAERTKVLKRIFDFELKPQIDTLDARMAQDQQALLVAQTQYDLLSNKEFKLKEELEELSATQVKRYEMGLEEVERKLREVEQRAFTITATQGELTTVEQRITTLRTDLKNNEQAIERIHQASDTLERDVAKYSQELESLEETAALEAQIDERKKSIEALNTLIEQNTRILASHQSTLDSLYPRIMEITSHIEAHKQGTCPTCGQATKPEQVPAMEDDRQHLLTEQQNTQQEQKALHEAKVNAERSIVRYENEIAGFQQTIVSNDRTRTQYAQFITRMQADLESNVRRIEDIKNSNHSILAALDLALQERERLQAKLQEDDVDIAKLHADRSRLSTILNDDRLSKAMNVKIREQNIEIKKEQEQLDEQLLELITQQNSLTASITHCRDAKRILSVDLPNYIIVKACSKLEKHINSFIANVKPGMVVRLLQNKRGVEFFYSPNGEDTDVDEWMSTKMASGFERELLSAAWRVALARAYSLDVLMLDEIDSAASVQASEKMFQELATLEGFEQMIIISHKPEIVEIVQAETDRVSSYLVENGTFTLQTY